MVPSQVPFYKGAVAYTFKIYTLYRRLGHYVQGIKEYARSFNDKIAAKKHAQKLIDSIVSTFLHPRGVTQELIVY